MPVVGKVDGTYVKRYKNVGGPGVLLMFGGYRLFKGGSVPITQETYDKYRSEIEMSVGKGWIVDIPIDDPKDTVVRSVYEAPVNNDPLSAPEDDDPENLFVKPKNVGMNQNKNYFVDEVKQDEGNIVNGHSTRMINAHDSNSAQVAQSVKSTYVNVPDRIIDTGMEQFNIGVKDFVTMVVPPAAVGAAVNNSSSSDMASVVTNVSTTNQNIMVKTAEIQIVDPDVIPDSVISGQMGYVHDTRSEVEDGFAGSERTVSCVSNIPKWQDACKMVGEIKNTEELEIIIKHDKRPSVANKAKVRLDEIKKNMAS